MLRKLTVILLLGSVIALTGCATVAHAPVKAKVKLAAETSAAR
jgi:hypothetical protein